MRHALAKESWKSLLPDATEWLEKVTVATGAPTVTGAHHVIAVKGDNDNKDNFTLNAPKIADALQRKMPQPTIWIRLNLPRSPKTYHATWALLAKCWIRSKWPRLVWVCS